MQVTINGKGNAGKHNGVPGDLLVLIEEEKHPELIRDESDLIYNLLLSVPTAALGGTVEIPTIDGKAKIKIEPGTQPGKVLRLRGKGLPNINSYGYSTGTGDLLVNVSVYIPEKLTKKNVRHSKMAGIRKLQAQHQPEREDFQEIQKPVRLIIGHFLPDKRRVQQGNYIPKSCRVVPFFLINQR